MAAEDEPYVLRSFGSVQEVDPTDYRPGAAAGFEEPLLEVSANLAVLSGTQFDRYTSADIRAELPIEFKGRSFFTNRFLENLQITPAAVHRGAFAYPRFSADFSGYHASPGVNFSRIVVNESAQTSGRNNKKLSKDEEQALFDEHQKNPTGFDRARVADAVVKSIPRLDGERIEFWMGEAAYDVYGQLDEIMHSQKFVKDNPAYRYIVDRNARIMVKRRTHAAEYINWLAAQHEARPLAVAGGLSQPMVFYMSKTIPYGYVVVGQELISVSLGTMGNSFGKSNESWISSHPKKGRVVKHDGNPVTHMYVGKRKRIAARLAYFPTPRIYGNQLRVEFVSQARDGQNQTALGHISLASINAFFIQRDVVFRSGWLNYLHQINPPLSEVITELTIVEKFFHDGTRVFPGAKVLAPPEVFCCWQEFQKVLYLQKLREVYFQDAIVAKFVLLGLDRSVYTVNATNLTALINATRVNYFEGFQTKSMVSDFDYNSTYYCLIASCIFAGMVRECVVKKNREPLSFHSEVLDYAKCLRLLDTEDLRSFDNPKSERLHSATHKNFANYAMVFYPRPGYFYAEMEGLDVEGAVDQVRTATKPYLSKEQIVLLKAQHQYSQQTGTANFLAIYNNNAVARTLSSVQESCNFVVCEDDLRLRLYEYFKRNATTAELVNRAIAILQPPEMREATRTSIQRGNVAVAHAVEKIALIIDRTPSMIDIDSLKIAARDACASSTASSSSSSSGSVSTSSLSRPRSSLTSRAASSSSSSSGSVSTSSLSPPSSSSGRPPIREEAIVLSDEESGDESDDLRVEIVETNEERRIRGLRMRNLQLERELQAERNRIKREEQLGAYSRNENFDAPGTTSLESQPNFGFGSSRYVDPLDVFLQSGSSWPDPSQTPNSLQFSNVADQPWDLYEEPLEFGNEASQTNENTINLVDSDNEEPGPSQKAPSVVISDNEEEASDFEASQSELLDFEGSQPDDPEAFLQYLQRGTKRPQDFEDWSEQRKRSLIRDSILKQIPNRPRLATFIAMRLHQQFSSQARK